MILMWPLTGEQVDSGIFKTLMSILSDITSKLRQCRKQYKLSCEEKKFHNYII